ncbi:hypothetical protein MI467_28575 [Delftia acidovorans]|uniref:hypothetical protein n=1 Tax=Delftia acidovorans TaxID=80866 RepID=UPI001EFD59E6|nr:hypothetical protein [Delftia acidovorans]MCG8990806.1 hypothetical protein [Delftia acidovorans]
MNKPASLRDRMPETADWVDQKRVQWGRDYVDLCIRRSLRGEPGWFYAMEGGKVLGTPWPMDALAPLVGGGTRTVAQLQAAAVLLGVGFAGFMREPEGNAHGAH